jgi:predicted Zn-dependent protease
MWSSVARRLPRCVNNCRSSTIRPPTLVEDIGERLVAEVPDYLEQPEFRYTFDVVNLKEINAFALPGGPMFLHRGMIEAARTDAEVAGVMAHELSHVILRHGTAQATKGQKSDGATPAGAGRDRGRPHQASSRRDRRWAWCSS